MICGITVLLVLFFSTTKVALFFQTTKLFVLKNVNGQKKSPTTFAAGEKG